MKNDNSKDPNLPVIKNRGVGKRSFVSWQGKESGPWDKLDEKVQFSPDGKHWAGIVSKEGKGFFLLLDGKEFGPFTELAPRGEFSPGGQLFFCRELFDAGSRVMENIVINGERVYGPCEAPYVHFFSPDGRRWMVHAKRGEFEGLVVDGREYGNYPFPKFIFEFSPDSRHWYALIGKGEKDVIVIDGREYGAYELKAPHFTGESRFVAYFRRREADWIFYNGREVGPFRYKNKRRIHIGDAVLADMIFMKKGKKAVRRCVISCAVDGSEKRILFSPRTGETLKEAIEIINAADTNEGVAAEYSYLRLKFQSLNKAFNVVRQELIRREKKRYDMLTIEFEGGKKENYYFDVTEFFGKFTGVLAKYSTKKEAGTE